MDAAAALLDQARTLGADLAGIAAVDDLRRTPDGPYGAPEVAWPEGATSIVVVAVAHPPDRPELDWWFGKSDPPGNRILAGIVQGLCDWATDNFGFRAAHLPYHVERGGAYLKDAAVLAGLGCVGLNNLLVTPQYGPRVRLRALTVDAALASTGPVAFDPCSGCDAPCRGACPRGAFVRPHAEPTAEPPVGPPGNPPALVRSRLPARDGGFSRSACFVQMDRDVNSAALHDAASLRRPDLDGPVEVIRYCRACELSCRVAAGGEAG